jgi:hypothetical protein
LEQKQTKEAKVWVRFHRIRVERNSPVPSSVPDQSGPMNRYKPIFKTKSNVDDQERPRTTKFRNAPLEAVVLTPDRPASSRVHVRSGALWALSPDGLRSRARSDVRVATGWEVTSARADWDVDFLPTSAPTRRCPVERCLTASADVASGGRQIEAHQGPIASWDGLPIRPTVNPHVPVALERGGRSTRGKTGATLKTPPSYMCRFMPWPAKNGAALRT